MKYIANLISEETTKTAKPKVVLSIMAYLIFNNLFTGLIIHTNQTLFIALTVAETIGISYLAIAYINSYNNRKKLESEKSIPGKQLLNLVHEIKNPICAIKGLLQIIEKKNSTNVEKRYVDVMLSEIERVDDMLQVLLSVDCLKDKAIKEVSFKSFFAEIITIMSGITDRKNVSLTAVIQSDAPNIFICKEGLKKVVINVIKNAIEAVDVNGKVEIMVSYERYSGLYKIKIEDDGPGFLIKNIDSIFESNFTTKENGSGLGLAISKK